AEGALQLRLRHLRATADVPLSRLLVQLLLRSSPRAPTVSTDPSTPAGRDVFSRQPRGLPRLAVACAFLVDRAGGDLLGSFGGSAAIPQRLLDVLVLTTSLRALLNTAWRHGHLLGSWLVDTPVTGQQTPSGLASARS